MARFYGKVGYADSVETTPGVWTDVITERNLFGDVLQNSSKQETVTTLNDNIGLSNRISVVADAYANQNFSKMKYVEFMGVLWTVSSVQVQPPRLILSLGEVYNGPTAPAS